MPFLPAACLVQLQYPDWHIESADIGVWYNGHIHFFKDALASPIGAPFGKELWDVHVPLALIGCTSTNGSGISVMHCRLLLHCWSPYESYGENSCLEDCQAMQASPDPCCFEQVPRKPPIASLGPKQ